MARLSPPARYHRSREGQQIGCLYDQEREKGLGLQAVKVGTALVADMSRQRIVLTVKCDRRPSRSSRRTTPERAPEQRLHLHCRKLRDLPHRYPMLPVSVELLLKGLHPHEAGHLVLYPSAQLQQVQQTRENLRIWRQSFGWWRRGGRRTGRS